MLSEAATRSVQASGQPLRFMRGAEPIRIFSADLKVFLMGRTGRRLHDKRGGKLRIVAGVLIGSHRKADC